VTTSSTESESAASCSNPNAVASGTQSRFGSGDPGNRKGFVLREGGGSRAGSRAPAPAAPPVELASPLVEALLFLERSQCSRQLPPYLQDFVCDSIQNGRSMSQAVGSAESCLTQRESCAIPGTSDFCRVTPQTMAMGITSYIQED